LLSETKKMFMIAASCSNLMPLYLAKTRAEERLPVKEIYNHAEAMYNEIVSRSKWY
jgi:hypothetical protein